MRRDRRLLHTLEAAGGAIATTFAAHTSERTLVGILVHVDVAPTTSENLTVTLDAGAGAEHDVVIYAKDMVGVTDIAYLDLNMPLFVGDALAVAYANSDARTVGVRLVLED